MHTQYIHEAHVTIHHVAADMHVHKSIGPQPSCMYKLQINARVQYGMYNVLAIQKDKWH